MTSKQISTAIPLLIGWGILFLLRPGQLSLIVPPITLFLTWVAVTGPSFHVTVRHPDVRRVINTPTMARVLLRPRWVPSHLTGLSIGWLAIAASGPAVAAGVLFQITGRGDVSLAHLMWWVILAPFILCASTLLTEALLTQTVATPFIGAFIFLLLIGSPIGSDRIGEDPATFMFWLPSIGIAVSAVWSLWLIDLLRAAVPESERRKRLGR